MNAKKRIAFLYGDAWVEYGDMKIEANYIEIDYVKNEVLAKGTEDSTGKMMGLPIFTQGGDVFTAHEMRYNFNTGKGVINKVVTQEGEGFIHGQRVKMNDEKDLFVSDAQYTTCNLEHPHFAIKAKKIKVVPEKHIVTGPFYLAVNDVPMPLGFMFGIFPVPKERGSGIVIPTYGETLNRGFFLRNGGFYWAASDYFDIKLVGDIYTNGSWRTALLSRYNKRYTYTGNVQIKLAKNYTGFEKDTTTYSNFLDGKEYWFEWKHNPVQRGNSKFSASVQLGSSNYQRNNSYGTQAFLSANFNSTVTYYKKFGNSPFSLNASLRQDQKQDGTMNFTLPDVAFNMQRQYPLKWIKGKSSAWHKKLSVGYSMSFKNRISNRLSPFSSSYIVNDIPATKLTTINFLNLDSLEYMSNYGIKHNIPIQTTIKAFKYFNVTPSFTYTESWLPKRLEYNDFNETDAGVVVDTVNKFSRNYSYNFATSLNTQFYGLFYIKKGNIEALRHTVRPTIGFQYQPDFGDTDNFDFYQEVQTAHDTITNNTAFLSRYQGAIFGAPGKGERQTLSFSLNNNFELKVKNPEDTVKKFKKVTIFDNISLSSSYNFAADSLNLAPMTVSARTKIFGLNINYSSTYDFYQLDTVLTGSGGNRKVNKYLASKNPQKFARLTSARLAVGTRLKPGKKEPVEEKEPRNENERLLLEDIDANPYKYVDFKIPWSLNINYNLRWVKDINTGEPNITQSLSFSGDLSLTPDWKIGFNSGFDLQQNDLTTTSLSIYRNMHCWDMRFTWIPFGIRTSYTFDIRVKASVLQDLKLSKRNDWINN